MSLINEITTYREELIKQLADVDTTLRVLSECPWLDTDKSPIKRITESPIPRVGSPKKVRQGAKSMIEGAPSMKEALFKLATENSFISTELIHKAVDMFNYNEASVRQALYQMQRDRVVVKGEDLVIRVVVNGKIQNLPVFPRN